MWVSDSLGTSRDMGSCQRACVRGRASRSPPLFDFNIRDMRYELTTDMQSRLAPRRFIAQRTNKVEPNERHGRSSRGQRKSNRGGPANNSSALQPSLFFGLGQRNKVSIGFGPSDAGLFLRALSLSLPCVGYRPRALVACAYPCPIRSFVSSLPPRHGITASVGRRDD